MLREFLNVIEDDLSFRTNISKEWSVSKSSNNLKIHTYNLLQLSANMNLFQINTFFKREQHITINVEEEDLESSIHLQGQRRYPQQAKGSLKVINEAALRTGMNTHQP